METCLLALLAELHCLANQPALGLSVIDEAMKMEEEAEEYIFHAELHRLAGELSGGSLSDAKAPPGPIRPSGASISISGPKPLDRVTRRARVHPASSFFILHSLTSTGERSSATPRPGSGL